jgi:hypothetical protein
VVIDRFVIDEAQDTTPAGSYAVDLNGLVGDVEVL